MDNDNHQKVSAKGHPQHRIVWLGKETSACRKTHEQLQDLYERRTSLRNDFRHRVTTQVVRQAAADQIDLLVTEELQIANMTKIGKGNGQPAWQERPGQDRPQPEHPKAVMGRLQDKA